MFDPACPLRCRTQTRLGFQRRRKKNKRGTALVRLHRALAGLRWRARLVFRCARDQCHQQPPWDPSIIPTALLYTTRVLLDRGMVMGHSPHTRINAMQVLVRQHQAPQSPKAYLLCFYKDNSSSVPTSGKLYSDHQHVPSSMPTRGRLYNNRSIHTLPAKNSARRHQAIRTRNNTHKSHQGRFQSRDVSVTRTRCANRSSPIG